MPRPRSTKMESFRNYRYKSLSVLARAIAFLLVAGMPGFALRFLFRF